ncbi:MAG: right-handed parallel beta-helix repeat-containing protein [Cyanobacteria bacterium J06623_7]
MTEINLGSTQDNYIVRQTNNIINVDDDFDGNLENAIAAAEDGDVVRLGANVYDISGITISKDITIDGISGSSIIDGGGTSGAILNLDRNASGATLRDLEITNGNIGISANETTDLTLARLEVHNIGLDETIRDGQNNIGISLTSTDGFRLVNSEIRDIGRKGVGIIDTDGGTIRGVTVSNVNLEAEHAQSFDAAGIKLFNTNEVTVANNELFQINAFNIWNDITSNTTIEGNVITGVGADFLQPEFNFSVDVAGIYNEKSYESVVADNEVEAVENFTAFRATEFTTESMLLGRNNFSSVQLNTEDFWANEEAERLVAVTEDPDAADFELFADDFFAEANIGT